MLALTINVRNVKLPALNVCLLKQPVQDALLDIYTALNVYRNAPPELHRVERNALVATRSANHAHPLILPDAYFVIPDTIYLIIHAIHLVPMATN